MKTHLRVENRCKGLLNPFILGSLMFIFCFMVDVKSQSVVYIDPSYTGGLNDGSLAHPFKSWANITSVNDNTSYLQRRGTKDTINGYIKLYHKTNVKLGVYGTGTDYAHIHNRANGVKTIDISTSSHCVVDGFHITASFQTVCGVIVSSDWQTTTFVGNNIKISNCFIEKHNWGIRAFKNVTSAFDTLIIENVKIRDILDDGIYIQNLCTIPLRGLVIDSCYISEVNKAWSPGIGETGAGGDGIQLVSYIDGWIIKNTTIDRRNSSNKFCIIHNEPAHTNTCSGTIENCTLYAPDQDFGGWGVYLEGLKTLTYRKNRMFVNERSNCMMLRAGTQLRCSFNIFSRAASGTPSQTVFDIGSGPNVFHNNTIYGAPSVFRLLGNYACEVYNNIFSSAGNVYSSTTGVTKDNNLYYNSTSTGTEPNSVYNVDPKFANAATGNFRLLSGSPCMDKGRNLGYTKDIADTILPQGAGYDIGAYEYTPMDTIPPTVPTNLEVSNKKYTSFTLTWNASTDNKGVAGYDVYKDGVWIAFVTGTSFDFSDLTQGKTYSITIKAKDVDGNISTPSTKSVTTLIGEPLAPSVPSGLVASNVSQTVFTVSWNASTDNVGVARYDVFRDGAFYSSVTGTTITINGSIGTTYSITVNARDSVGNISGLSTPLSVTTMSACTGSDPWSNTSFTNQTGIFTVQYDVMSSGEKIDGVTGLSDSAAVSYANLACIVRFNNSGMIDARDSNVYAAVNPFPYLAGITYHVRIEANVATKSYDVYVKQTGTAQETLIGSQYGFRAQASKLNNFAELTSSCHLTISNLVIGVDAPSVPTGLTSSNVSSSGFTLSWTASTDNVGVTGYDVYKNDVLATSVTGTSATITGLVPSTTYSMTVKAKDAAGNVSGASNALSVTTSPDTQAPSVPAGLTSSNVSSSGFTLSWTASTDNVSVTGYDVYKNGVLATSVTGTSATITGLVPSTTYAMTVKAKDAASNVSGASNALSVTTSPDTQAPSVPAGLASSGIASTYFTLSWTASTDNVGVTGYDVFNNGVLIVSATETTVNVTGLAPNTTYSMTVKAKDAAGNVSAASTALSVTTLPTALPAPWNTQDIGAVGLVGSASYSNGTFTVNGAGADIWSTVDAFRYVYQPFHGDCEIIVRVATQSNPQPYAKSGIMIRENFAVGSKNASLFMMPTGGINFQRRLSTNGYYSNTTTTGTLPLWMKITRVGDAFTGYISSDGTTWTQIGTDNVSMSADVYVGFAVTSHKVTALGTSTFDNVSVHGVDVEAPSAPTALSDRDVTQNSCTLSWTASTDNVGIAGYDVYQNGTFIKSETSNTTVVSGLSAGSVYSYYIKAKDVSGNVSLSSSAVSVITLSTCTGGPMPFTNTSFVNQSSSFTAEIDVIPSTDLMVGLVGLSNGRATTYSNLACIVRFYSNGMVEARNGNTYTAANSFAYTANTAYHIRMVINISTHKYDAYVKQIGGSEVLIASQYAFRTEQASVTQLNDYCVQSDSYCLGVSNFMLNGVKSSPVMGFASVNKTKDVVIYPNPALVNDLINIQISERSILKIVDVQGKLLLSKTVDPGLNSIPLNLKTGLYIIKTIGENGNEYSGKLLIK